jgi:uncharacterized protein YxjI
MKYPLKLSFKVLALSPQISVSDAEGRLIMYLRQQFLKLKEAVTIFADSAQSRPIYRIDADRILDISARYAIATMQGEHIGSLQRRGLRSLWRSHYEILEGERIVMSIQEENPWAKMGDSVLSGIPLIGMLSGYLFHPSYRVSRPDGTLVFRARKESAFWEGIFSITQESEASSWEESLGILSLLMMLLLERDRG